MTGWAWKLFVSPSASVRGPSPVAAKWPLQRLRREAGGCPSSTQLMGVLCLPLILPRCLQAEQPQLDVIPALRVGDLAVSICWMLRDSCNHHAKCIIHKLFSMTFCTVALIIIITEAQ